MSFFKKKTIPLEDTVTEERTSSQGCPCSFGLKQVDKALW